MSQNAATSSQLQEYFEKISLSHAPAALKAAAQAQIEERITGEGVDADAAATDRLADAISELPGTLDGHLDFMRLLHGEAVQHTRHRRANMAAVMRDKARRLGRCPVEADFPAHHPVRVFALAYWGGVAAWSAGSAGRVQHAKGFWSVRHNQIAALRSAVAKHPGVPATHALLRIAGLHRLAIVLNGEELALLADEAGVDRARVYKVVGWWTAERVIDAYADECRRARVTLSSSALVAIGGQASSLRVYATRHFGSFRAFQSAVIKRHHDILPPRRPTASDGTRLDSWSEVVAYHALRDSLPDVHVAIHVVLPGEKSRSGDFVIAGRLWVEVLGFARDTMKMASSKSQRKYAAQWTSKLACYNALGVTPIVIGSADIHNPQRLTERISEIARQLGVTPQPAPLKAMRSMRAKGTWTFDMLCQAVTEVAGSTGKLPTYAALTSAGYGHAAQLLRQPEERQRVATALGLQDPHRKGVWTQARVVEELAAWVRMHGKFPTKVKLRRAGQGGLSSAIDRLWAGDRETLRAAVEKLAGKPLPPRRAANGTLATQAQWAAALKPLADRLGYMPSSREAADAGLSTAWSRASRSAGVAAIARLLGVPCVGPIRRSRTEMLHEFAHLARSVGAERLTTTMVRDSLGSGGLARLRKCGGIASVRAEIDRLSGGSGQAV